MYEYDIDRAGMAERAAAARNRIFELRDTKCELTVTSRVLEAERTDDSQMLETSRSFLFAIRSAIISATTKTLFENIAGNRNATTSVAATLLQDVRQGFL